jgi:hypothetical protein
MKLGPLSETQIHIKLTFYIKAEATSRGIENFKASKTIQKTGRNTKEPIKSPSNLHAEPQSSESSFYYLTMRIMTKCIVCRPI